MRASVPTDFLKKGMGKKGREKKMMKRRENNKKSKIRIKISIEIFTL